MNCDAGLSLKEQGTGDQDLPDVIEHQIGDAKRELRHAGEGVEDQYDIGSGKQYCANRIDDGSSGRREDRNAQGDRRHDENGTEIENAEDLEGFLDLHGLKDVRKQSSCSQSSDDDAVPDPDMPCLRDQSNKIQNMSDQESQYSGKKDLLPVLRKNVSKIQQDVADHAKQKTVEELSVERIVYGLKVIVADQHEHQRRSSFQDIGKEIFLLVFALDKQSL